MKRLVFLLMVVVLFSGCESLDKYAKSRVNKLRSDLSEFDRVELVKKNVAIYKEFGKSEFYVKQLPTGSAILITEQDVINYILFDEKITDKPKK